MDVSGKTKYAAGPNGDSRLTGLVKIVSIIIFQNFTIAWLAVF